jgi:DNA-binding NarL/FixJ family response regulator
VVARVARGATDAAIAHELGISRRTVGKHLENAYAALGVHDRTSAALRLTP